jgi:hypothetical protein
LKLNDQTKKLLSDLAKSAGLEINFADGAFICISGFRYGESPFVLINLDQPDCDLIFAILQKIGLVASKDKFFSLPWFLNRPYENEFAGEIAYKSRRVMRQQYNLEWRASLWALTAYPHIPCNNDFSKFLRRHPEKWRLMPLVWYGYQKSPIPGKFFTGIKILFSMFAARFMPEKQS